MGTEPAEQVGVGAGGRKGLQGGRVKVKGWDSPTWHQLYAFL